MLRSNLATEPFYNTRLVRIAMAAVAVVALGLTAYNGVQVWQLRAQGAEQGRLAAQNEAEARELREKARVIRQSIDRDKLAAVQLAAREANQLIDRRAFSWTDLFNRFETTLPGDVRISAVQPQVDQEGRMLVAVTVVSRRVEDLDAFIEALEKTGAFHGVLSRQENAEEGGTLRSVIQGYYGPPPGGGHAADAAVPPPAASEPQQAAPGNLSALGVAPGPAPGGGR